MRLEKREGVKYVSGMMRAEIAAQVDRLRRDSAAFRLAEDFGCAVESVKQIEFHFERCQ